MRTGVILPIFTDDGGEALAVARRAEAAGVDGVFCFDHLWPLGQPERPALAPFPVLGAVAATTERVALATLVARVGLVPDDVLLSEFAALDDVAPGRVIAGLGVGDRQSALENESYGVAFETPAVRRDRLRRCTRELGRRGLPVWIGGGAPATVAVAEEERVAVNLWRATPDVVAAQARRLEVTWAGPAPGAEASERTVGPLVGRLAAAGASWAVFAWPAPLEALAAAAASTGGRHGGW